MSAKDSLNKYLARYAEKLEREQRPRRKRGKPEKILRDQIIQWLRNQDFDVNAYESQAVFSVRAQRYLHSQVVPGHPDIAGACPGGVACWIEVKDKGRLSTLRPAQRAFLLAKIQLGCFSCVTDSIDRLEQLWKGWDSRRKMEPQLAKNFLLRHLPNIGGEGEL